VDDGAELAGGAGLEGCAGAAGALWAPEVRAWPGMACAKAVPRPSAATAAPPAMPSDIARVRWSSRRRCAAARYAGGLPDHGSGGVGLPGAGIPASSLLSGRDVVLSVG